MIPVLATAPERPAARAKGTVRPSDIPITTSRTASLAVKWCSMCGVCGIERAARSARRRNRRPSVRLGPPAARLERRARDGKPERLPEARRVEAPQPLAGVGRSGDPLEEARVSGISQPLVEETVDDRGAEEAREALAEGALACARQPGHERGGRPVPREQCVAHA